VVFYVGKTLSLYLASSNFDRLAVCSTAAISENITEIFNLLGIN